MTNNGSLSHDKPSLILPTSTLAMPHTLLMVCSIMYYLFCWGMSESPETPPVPTFAKSPCQIYKVFHLSNLSFPVLVNFGALFPFSCFQASCSLPLSKQKSAKESPLNPSFCPLLGLCPGLQDAFHVLRPEDLQCTPRFFWRLAYKPINNFMANLKCSLVCMLNMKPCTYIVYVK